MSKRHLDFDAVVAGAGPAGIVSACIAAEQGRRTALLDMFPSIGGQIWHGSDEMPATAQARRWLKRLYAAGVQVFRGMTAIGAPSPHMLFAESPEGAVEIAWQKFIIATGARELFLPFPGWTLPNVIGAGGLQDMVKSGWPVAGKRVVIAGTGPLLFPVGANLREAGAEVVLMAEQTDWGKLIGFGMKLPVMAPSKLLQAMGFQMKLLGVPYRPGCWPVSAQGKDRVESVTLTNGSKTWTEPCDYLACGFGLVSNLELPNLVGCRVENGKVWVNPSQETSVPDVYCAGEPTGVGGIDRAIVEGKIAGYAVAGQTGQVERMFPARQHAQRFTEAMDSAFAIRRELKQLSSPDTIVCRCEDVTYGQLRNYSSWLEAKLHTRCGMGPCQGRICGCATRALFGWQPESVRPPVFPTSVGVLAEMGDGKKN